MHNNIENFPTIFTIDAREHGFLEGIQKHFKLSPDQMFIEIRTAFNGLINVLNKKKIPYDSLKNALVPQNDGKEIAFVFDSKKFESGWYGYEVFEILIPLLDREAIASILCGDYIGEEKDSAFLRSLFFDHIVSHDTIDYIHHGLFYIVYINNLSDRQFDTIHEGLQPSRGYVGYFDLTFSSPIKTVLSGMLIRTFLKAKSNILNPTEASIDENITSYPSKKTVTM